MTKKDQAAMLNAKIEGIYTDAKERVEDASEKKTDEELLTRLADKNGQIKGLISAMEGLNLKVTRVPITLATVQIWRKA